MMLAEQTETLHPPIALRTTGLPVALRPPTPSEQRVLELLLDGYTNREIGRHLGRSENTVKNQVAVLLRKFRAPSRAWLIAHRRWRATIPSAVAAEVEPEAQLTRGR